MLVAALMIMDINIVSRDSRDHRYQSVVAVFIIDSSKACEDSTVYLHHMVPSLRDSPLEYVALAGLALLPILSALQKKNIRLYS